MSSSFPFAYSEQETTDYVAFDEHEHPADALLDKALTSLDPDGQIILDFGAGLGRMVPMLLAHGAAKVVGVEPSKSMVAEANRRLAQGGFGESVPVEFQVLESDVLPFDVEQFDGVLSRFVFHYIADTQNTLNELARVLKPNGWLLAIFSDVHLKDGNDDLKNTILPLTFLNQVAVETLVKSGGDIVREAKQAGFVIERYENPEQGTLAMIPDSYPYKDKIKSFETGFLLARKS